MLAEPEVIVTSKKVGGCSVVLGCNGLVFFPESYINQHTRDCRSFSDVAYNWLPVLTSSKLRCSYGRRLVLSKQLNQFGLRSISDENGMNHTFSM